MSGRCTIRHHRDIHLRSPFRTKLHVVIIHKLSNGNLSRLMRPSFHLTLWHHYLRHGHKVGCDWLTWWERGHTIPPCLRPMRDRAQLQVGARRARTLRTPGLLTTFLLRRWWGRRGWLIPSRVAGHLGAELAAKQPMHPARHRIVLCACGGGGGHSQPRGHPNG